MGQLPLQAVSGLQNKQNICNGTTEEITRRHYRTISEATIGRKPVAQSCGDCVLVPPIDPDTRQKSLRENTRVCG